MPFVITAADRASFLRCRRQWDFGARTRQDLEPLRPALPDLDRAVRDALAVYYFPGMWDWDRGVRLPLVVQELERALDRQRRRGGSGGDPADPPGQEALEAGPPGREALEAGPPGREALEAGPPWQEALEAGRALLASYFAWAPAADRFSPVLVETDFEVDVLDPARPGSGLVTPDGQVIRYTGRVDLMAVDARDAYWIVRHRVVDGDWPPTEQLVSDEEQVAACWAWEQFYLGMAMTGIVWNEIRRPPRTAAGRPGPPRPRRPWWRRPARAAGPAVRQHEPSGGGRSIPQHRRMYVQASPPARVEPVEQQTEEGYRRTWLRRSPADVAEAGRRLAADLAEMARPDAGVYPEPSDRNCPPCPFLAPCQALMDGHDAGPILRSGYRRRPPDGPEEGRLGGRAWGMGRGAAPPRFRGHPRA
jgi:hypothetical protein